MEKINIIPKVEGSDKICQGQLFLAEEIGIENDSFEQWCIKAFLIRSGRKLGGENIIQLKRNVSIAREGYRLQVTPEHIYIEASEETGVIWAFTTLAALLNENQIPCCDISDKPKFSHRGVSVDCARHFYPAKEIKKIIEEISLVKMNVFHWHLEDDQGWRIESFKYPKLHEVSKEYYTQKEIQEICEYAKIRGVEIIPEIEIPGHAYGILSAYPQYSCSGKQVSLARTGGIYPVILCAGRGEVTGFLEDLLEEILPLFPGARVHLGGDEAPKNEWKKCRYCNAMIKKKGLRGYEELQGDFISRIAAALKRYGKTAICWNETLLSSRIPENLQIQYWTLNHRKSMEDYAGQGKEWIYSDMFELYLDYPYSMTSLKKVYETTPCLGNQEVEKSEKLRQGLKGLEGCLWSEHIKDDKTLEQRLFPRLYALAEISWSGKQNYEEFVKRLELWIQRPKRQAVEYMEKEYWVPEGKQRQQEALAYMAMVTSSMSEEIREQTVGSSAPSEEFGRAFITKFFQPEDIPLLNGNQ